MAGLPLSYDYIYIFTHIEVELSNTDCALEFSQVAFVIQKYQQKDIMEVATTLTFDITLH